MLTERHTVVAKGGRGPQSSRDSRILELASKRKGRGNDPPFNFLMEEDNENQPAMEREGAWLFRDRGEKGKDGIRMGLRKSQALTDKSVACRSA